MVYEITFKFGQGETTKKIGADDATVRGGFLYLTSGIDPDEVIHAIFADWKRIVKVKE